MLEFFIGKKYLFVCLLLNKTCMLDLFQEIPALKNLTINFLPAQVTDDWLVKNISFRYHGKNHVPQELFP